MKPFPHTIIAGIKTAFKLVNIYSHAIKSADEAATEALDNMLTPTNYRKEQVITDTPKIPNKKAVM